MREPCPNCQGQAIPGYEVLCTCPADVEAKKPKPQPKPKPLPKVKLPAPILEKVRPR